MRGMKQRKFMVFLLSVVLAAVLTGCGSGGDGLKNMFGENGDREPRQADIYEYSDIAGCWYAVSDDGKIYMLSMSDRGGAGEETLDFSMRVLSEKKFHYYGNVGLTPYTDENGKEKTSCMIFIGSINGDSSSGELYAANFYENETFHVFPPCYLNEEGEMVQYEGFDLLFTRQFPFPSPEKNSDTGVLSGVWYTFYEDEYTVLMIQPDGKFLLCQEESFITGVSRLEGDTLSLTCEYIDGEPYTGSDATISTAVLENHDIDDGEFSLHAVSGKQTGSWTAAVSDESSGEITYHLDLEKNGSFRFGMISEKEGIYREAIGACLYQSDTESDMLYISNFCSTDFRVRASMTLNPDGSITMVNGKAELHFTKD